MMNFERLANKYDEEQRRENNSKMQIQAVKRTKKSSLHVLLLVFAVVIVASIVYYFWPTVKGLGVTAKVSALIHKDVSLTGIFYSEDDPIAIVNGKIVHEEDMVGDVKVLKIHKDNVELERAGRKWSQNMHVVEKGIGSGLPVLLELGSPKCPPCRQMMPILEMMCLVLGQMQEIQRIVFGTDTHNRVRLAARVNELFDKYRDHLQKYLANKGFSEELPTASSLGHDRHLFEDWDLDQLEANWDDFSEQNASERVRCFVDIVERFHQFNSSMPAVGGETATLH